MTTLFRAAGLAVTQASDVQGDMELTADVIVIGSGAGGAVVAYEMAKAGRNVLIFEAGPYVPSSEFTEDFTEAMDTLYAERGTQANVDGDLLVLQGRCVGGSTVINGCVAFRTPEHILTRWQREFGLTNLTIDALTPHFEKVEKHLHIQRNGAHEINANAHTIVRGCDALGLSWQPFERNVKACALTGHCLSGCASDRKQSMLVTYLPWAIAQGARLFADTRVQRIVSTNGHVDGVLAEVIDPASSKVKARIQATAKQVIVAAGAIQSPLLLQRSGLATSSAQLGKNFACHPSTMVVAEYAERVDSWSGALLGVYIDEWAHPDKGGFLLEAGGAGPVELSGVTDPGTGVAYMNYMQRVGHLAGLVTLIHDEGVGRVEAKAERYQIHYKLSDKNFAQMLAAIKAASQVHFAAGALRVFLPTVQQHVLTPGDDIDALLATLSNQPHTFRIVSYHPQGTCRMGADPAQSVVGPNGEAHDVKGLFVADASIFPTSVVVNPQVSVYALASYIAEGILAETTV